MMGSPCAVLLLAALLCRLDPSQALSYKITPTGNPGGATPQYFGVGAGTANEGSSSWNWLRYLNPEFVRIFVNPLLSSTSPPSNSADWVAWVGRYKQYGVSFDGKDVVDQDAWLAAVANERSISSSPSDPDYFNWLRKYSKINWDLLLKTLNTTSNSPLLGQTGNPQYVLDQLQRRKYSASCVWDVRCKNLGLATSDPGDPEYWRRRWEMYRLFYFGGRWMAAHGVDFVELYNEPNKDPCETPALWADDWRIRSQGVQDAYADFNSWAGKQARIHVAAPTTSPAWVNGFSDSVVQLLNTPFPNAPGDVDPSFTGADWYSYHKYGSFSASSACANFSASCHQANGRGLESSYLGVEAAIDRLSPPQHLPAYISEFNVYTNQQANSKVAYFDKVHTFDQAQTAAALAAMVSSTMAQPSSPEAIAVFKFAQTLSSGSAIVKNGLFFAGALRAPYDISGSTKSGEAYRLLLRKSPPARRNGVWELAINPSFTSSWLTAFLVDDDQAYYCYVINEQWASQVVTLSLAALPSVNPGSTVVTSAVTDDCQGAVASLAPMPDTLRLTLPTPPGSTFMLTIPKVPTAQAAVPAAAAATVKAGANAGVNFAGDPTLLVSTSQTSADDVAVGLLRFPALAMPPSSIVSAVLQVYLGSIAGAPLPQAQVLTVTSIPAAYAWDPATVTWDSMPLLKAPPAEGVRSTYDNFVRFGDNDPAPDSFLAGMPTVPVALPDGGVFLRVDVTELVKRSDPLLAYAIVRMFRYDASSAGPGDDPQGVYSFSKASDPDPTHAPMLLIDYQTA